MKGRSVSSGYVEGLNDARTLLADFLNIRLKVNLEGEATKTGFLPDELDGAISSKGILPHVVVKGLVVIPPPTNDPEQARSHFRRLCESALALSPQPISTISLKELSMGRSNEYHVAVEERATTMVRLGAAILGAWRA